MINNIAILFFASVVIIGCDSKTKLKEDGNENNVVSNFLSDVQSLEIDTNTNSIVAFKELAEEIADNKMVVSKKNIKKVLIKSKDYSNCVVVTGNHTIVKIISFDNCQKSGSWEACMPFVEGYIKKGKLNYKKDYMNNVIGTPDGQQRVAYFFINDKKKPKIKTYSFEKTPNLSYYKNGNIKVKGLGFKKFDRYFVSAKDGLDLMEGAGLNSKKIANIPDSTELWIKSIEGKWLNIYTVFYLNVGDEGYDNEQIDPSQLGGYVNNKFIEIKPDSTKNHGVWTYYYESGEIEREELHSIGFIKKIHYGYNGFITKIEEQDGDENDLFGWGPDRISNTFHKNGKINCVNEASDGGAVSYCFDENGKKLHSYDYVIGDYGFILSKDIRDLYFRNSEAIFKEINKLKISDDSAAEKIENATIEENIILEDETNPKSTEKSPNYYICYSENNNKNLQLWIGFDEKSNASKVKYKEMNLHMDLVFVNEVNENPDGPYPVLVEYYNEIYQEKVNGVYKLTKSGNWYYAEYTRGSDNKQFNFTIDNKSNNFSKTPCF
tara:strand:- start:3327 stop:4973 length:1647 start_codon:yes stop_codon:yes gene_type:complete